MHKYLYMKISPYNKAIYTMYVYLKIIQVSNFIYADKQV